MIQRIQSFYLVLAACAMALCFMFPIAKYKTADGLVNAQYSLVKSQAMDKTTDVQEFEQIGGNMSSLGYAKAPVWPMIALVVAVILIALVAVFMYNNRTRQVRVVAIGFLLNVVYIFIVFIWAADAFIKPLKQAFQGEWITTYSVATWAPVASALLLFLAQNAIKKDEKKVRDADRIR